MSKEITILITSESSYLVSYQPWVLKAYYGISWDVYEHLHPALLNEKKGQNKSAKIEKKKVVIMN